jgi:D-alanine-D-alanine ligase
MSNLRVAILVPPAAPDGAADRADTYLQAAEISECLSILGNECLTIIFADDRDKAATDLRRAAPDVVVNLVEDVPEGADHLHLAPSLLDALGLRYTGAPTAALTALADKRQVRAALRTAGLPVAPGLDDVKEPAKAPSPYPLPPGRGEDGALPNPRDTSPFGGEVGAERRVRGPSAPDDSHQQFIVKSAIEHASIGLDATSIVTGPAAARATIAERQARLGGSWFAEAYIDGREFNVSLLDTSAGPQALPIAEILFLAHAERPKIVGYDEKWAAASAAYAETPRVFPGPEAEPQLFAELTRLGLETWRRFGLRGYARIDFRVAADGQPYILDVNANPCLARDAGFCAAAQQAGLSQTDIVAQLLETALA